MPDNYSTSTPVSSTAVDQQTGNAPAIKTWADVATVAQKDRVKKLYDNRAEMVRKRNEPYVQFNDRTLKEFIDDCEKRLNAYVLSKEAQGKEDWQANYATRAYANKLKALLAATARDVPDMHYSAVNENDEFDNFSSDVMKNLVRHSYNQGNPQEDLFFLAWSNAGHGTVLSYEGFEKQTFVKKRIKSFDLLTGDVQEEVIERASFGEPVSYELSLMSVLIRNFFIRDIQEQPDIIIELYYADRERFDANFGSFPNAQYVKDLAEIKADESDTYLHPKWKEACENGKGFYVCKYMNKYLDSYQIVANGVELFNGPMLWVDITRSGFGKKMYPVAKTIYEPFANTDFFYGNSQPNAAMGEGDSINSLYNGSLDKNYRAMVPPLLVGMVNKDMLDLEDEVVAGDTKIYVDDINQVKQMDIKGVSDSDVKMIQLISQGLDLTTLDPQQQGAPQRYVTARAAVAADERARQLKGVFFMFMESLWLQKVRLRIPNVLLSYGMPKLVEVIGEDGAKKMVEQYRTLNVKNTKLSGGTKGTLGIEFRPRADIQANKKALKLKINADEAQNLQDGNPYEKIILPYGFLDRLSFDVEVIPESLWQSSQAIDMAMITEKITIIRNFFPEYFSSNKELLFRDMAKAYKDDASRYKLPKTMDFAQEQALAIAQKNVGANQNPSGGGPGDGPPVTVDKGPIAAAAGNGA